MSKSYPFLFVLCVAQLAGLSWGQSCYYPGGGLASTYSPCYPNAGTSLCCPMGWTCFSSNLCMVTDTKAAGSQYPIGTAQRGACTNSAGDNDLCGDYCLDASNESLVSCGSNRYCCGSKAEQGTCNCETGEGTFAAEGGIAKTIMEQEGMEKTATVVQSTSSSDSTASRSASTLSTSTTTASASKTSGTSSGSATDGTPINTSSSAPTVSPDSLPFTQKTGFKVMIAILAIAAAAIIIAGLILWRKKKKNPDEDYQADLQDNSSIDLGTIPLPPNYNLRPSPDPYGYPHRTASPTSGNPIEVRETSRFRDEESTLTPPVVDPYRIPPAMASIPMRPYEGT